MKLDKFRSLDETVAVLFRERSPPSTDVEPTRIKAEPVQPAEEIRNAMTTAERPQSVLDGLNLETAIRLRWTQRDIRAKRAAFLTIPPNDLRAVIELELVELRDDTPALTDAGLRALDRS
jgi:hypothetical protein